ncbi:MAG: glycosyltransferase family 4 protein [Gaiellaceae bacterium]
MASVFYAYRDSPQRRRALSAPLGAPERYLLFGLDQLVERGWTARHDLERSGRPPMWARAGGAASKAALERAGGYGGDFATVLASLRQANRADVVLSTVDTVGIPLLLLAKAGRLHPPLVYIAIGLPERVARLRSVRMRRLYASALAATAAVAAYSEHEAADLVAFMAEHGESTRVEFVPFGVDDRAFVPSLVQPSVDVVMAGADPHRDVDLFVDLAAEMPNRSFRLVTTAERARGVAPSPNLGVESDIPFEDMKRRLEEARVVALPVLDNSYSGATTVLLQAMALGKPIVVSRTKAIAAGYGLVDGENCRLIEPGDAAGFGRAVAGVLRDEWHARSLGARARATVEADLGWNQYVDRLAALLRDAALPRLAPG